MHAGNTLRAREVALRPITARLALAGVVNQKLRHLTESAALFSEVSDDPYPAGLSAPPRQAIADYRGRPREVGITFQYNFF